MRSDLPAPNLLPVALLAATLGFSATPKLGAQEPSKPESEHEGAEMLLKVLGALAGGDRPEWDQEKAVEIVQSVIDPEEKGDFAWDKIAWETDVAKITARAEQEQKPIFVYLFLKRDYGPKEAEC